MIAPQVLDGGNAVHARHLQIHEDDVRFEFGDKLKTFRAVNSFADNFDIIGGFEDEAQAFADNKMVVCDHYADHYDLPTMN